jgi:hypothetical protein
MLYGDGRKSAGRIMESEKSPHIQNTSATLFGLCYVVLTSLKALKLSNETFADELTGASMFLFMASCIASFLSIRSNTGRASYYERLGDIVFMGGLLTLFITTLLILFRIA